MDINIAKPLMKVDVAQVLDLLADKRKVVIAQTAPSVRVALGEPFSLPIGADVTKKMVTALRRVGFAAVFDTNFGADCTIVEESTEFLKKLREGGPFPQFTSCCIGWVSLAERTYHELLPFISSTKSPLGCLGSIAKTYYASLLNRSPKDIVVVSIVPCILKKNENKLPYNTTDGIPDVDFSLTTKELASILYLEDIDFKNLPDGEFDSPIGESTGSGMVFGIQGGVLESCLRCAEYYDSGRKNLDQFVFTPSAYSPDIKETKFLFHGKEYLACKTGLAGIRVIYEQVKNNTCPYALIEVMACPGGCIMGAGQPLHLPSEGISPLKVKELRTETVKEITASYKNQISAENESLGKVYETLFDGKPGSEKALANLHRKR